MSHYEASDSLNEISRSEHITSSKNLELVRVSIPSYEDITGSWDKFDFKKIYKFDYKFEDFKFEYRVYIIKVEFGNEIQWNVRRYELFLFVFYYIYILSIK